MVHSSISVEIYMKQQLKHTVQVGIIYTNNET